MDCERNAKHYNNRILIWFTGLIDGTESVSMIKEVKLRCSPVVVSTTAYRFVQRDHSSLPGIRDEPTPPEWLLKERERERMGYGETTMSLTYQQEHETTFSNQHRLEWSFP